MRCIIIASELPFEGVLVSEGDQIRSSSAAVDDNHRDGRVVRDALQHGPDRVASTLDQQDHNWSLVTLAFSSCNGEVIGVLSQKN